MGRDVPHRFQSRWIQVYSELLHDCNAAVEAGDELAIERALKWQLVGHQLFLRLDCGKRAGRRWEDSMTRRFALWDAREYRSLVADWRRDVEGALEADGSMIGDKPLLEEAVRLIHEGCVTKAMKLLEGSGLGDLDLPAIRAQLESKHPQERQEWLKAADDAPGMGRVELPNLFDTLKDLPRNAGTGADRFRMEYLRCGARGSIAEPVRQSFYRRGTIMSTRRSSSSLLLRRRGRRLRSMMCGRSAWVGASNECLIRHAPRWLRVRSVRLASRRNSRQALVEVANRLACR